MSRGSKIGWMLGLLSGTALGVLFAPQKGENLRKKIKSDLKKGGRGYEPLVDDLKLMGSEVVELGRDMYEGSELEKRVKKTTKQVKRKAAKVKKTVQRKTRSVKKQATKVVKKVNKKLKKQ